MTYCFSIVSLKKQKNLPFLKMKNYQTIVLAVVTSLLFSNCGESKPAPAVESIESNAATVVKEENLGMEKAGEVKPEEVKPLASINTVTCEEKEEKMPEREDAIILKTCTYGTYRTVSTGTPDFNGRYSWEYSLYHSQGEEFVKVDNALLFNHQLNGLLDQVNKKIKADYQQFSSDPETKDCFEGRESIGDFKIEDLGISFEPGKLVFHVEFGLPTACMPVSGTSVSFDLKEVKKYLNK
ncbi:MAG: hypothetical protein ACO1OQ_09825 [Rufibacter sp.]